MTLRLTVQKAIDRERHDIPYFEAKLSVMREHLAIASERVTEMKTRSRYSGEWGFTWGKPPEHYSHYENSGRSGGCAAGCARRRRGARPCFPCR